MKTFFLWYDFPDGYSQLLATFRQPRGRRVWAWFEEMRRDSMFLPPEGFRLSGGHGDYFSDIEPGWPKLAHWHIMRVKNPKPGHSGFRIVMNNVSNPDAWKHLDG